MKSEFSMEANTGKQVNEVCTLLSVQPKFKKKFLKAVEHTCSTNY